MIMIFATFVLLEETVMAGKDSVAVETYENWMEAQSIQHLKKEVKTFKAFLNCFKQPLFLDNRLVSKLNEILVQ